MEQGGLNAFNLKFYAILLLNFIAMKIGFRIPNLNKKIAARTSLSRLVRHNLGVKAPRGMGWITNPKKAAYNKVYNKTSKGCMLSFLALIAIPLFALSFLLIPACNTSDSADEGSGASYVHPFVDRRGRMHKGHVRMPVSTHKNAIKNQNRSRYYYHTRGKYRRK